jgi:hypothetical protein
MKRPVAADTRTISLIGVNQIEEHGSNFMIKTL